MPQPTQEEFLRNLYRMKEDCRTELENAEQRGDLREASEFREYLERVQTMIELHDGDTDHLASHDIPEGGPLPPEAAGQSSTPA
jgi:hypothetical protein